MANLVLLAGIPGAGKSTWAKTFFDLKYAIISSDEIRTRLAGSTQAAHAKDLRPWDEFYRQIEDRLTHGVDVIADATFLTRGHRTRAREVADTTKANLHLIFFKNWWMAELRNETRTADSKVPREAMDGMMLRYWDSLVEIAQEHYDTVTKIEAFN